MVGRGQSHAPSLATINNFYLTTSSRQLTVRILIGNLQSPRSIPRTNIQHILRLFTNRALKEGFATLRIKDQVHKMGCLEDFELLLVGGDESFAFAAEGGIAAAVLDEAAGYGGAD